MCVTCDERIIREEPSEVRSRVECDIVLLDIQANNAAMNIIQQALCRPLGIAEVMGALARPRDFFVSVDPDEFVFSR